MYDPNRMPEVSIPSGLSVRELRALRITLARLRMTLWKQDNAGFEQNIDELRRLGFAEIADMIVARRLSDVLCQRALAELGPWWGPHTPLHTWN